MSEVVLAEVLPIVSSMLEEEIEHQYATFGEVYIKFRRAVAAWIMEICDFFHLHPTTTHAAIAYLDRLQPNDRFSRNDWQMLAIACVLISAKYNELEDNIPSRAILEQISHQRITNKLILGFEIWILMKMCWKMNAYTPMAFLSSYMTVGVTYTSDRCRDFPIFEHRTEKLNQEIVQLADMVMLEESFKLYRASDIACAIVYICREKMGIFPVWRTALRDLMKNSDPTSPIICRIIRLIKYVRASMPPEPEEDRDSVSIEISSPTRSDVSDADSYDGKENVKGSGKVVGITSPVSITNTDHIEHNLYI